MADDLDFVWAPSEPATRHSGPSPTAAPAATATKNVEWVTLRQAAERTSVPVSTIRNWARKEKIPTRLAAEAAGPRRMVGLDEVVARAQRLGRLPGANGGRAQPTAAPEDVVDLTHGGGDHPVPEGHMLVPLDAWEKVLVQLGNLHEAGRELAEARERAARAETEVQFLRERVADLRQQTDRGEPAPAPSSNTETPPSWYRRLVRRLRTEG